MFGSVRAGGYAAATLVLSASFICAGPSFAWDMPSQAPVNSATAIIQVTTPARQESLQIAVPVQSVPLADAANTITVDTATPTTTDTATTDAAETAPTVAPVVVVASPVAKAERATLAQLVSAHRSSAIPDRERECLAGAIYFEAKGESLPGQVAVGQVIANRAKSGRFPTSWCGVVFQRSQFSFVRGHALPPIPRASANWKTAVAIAHIVANDLADAVAPRSLFFHARYVSPNWKRMSKVATVGNHIFYR